MLQFLMIFTEIWFLLTILFTLTFVVVKGSQGLKFSDYIARHSHMFAKFRNNLLNYKMVFVSAIAVGFYTTFIVFTASMLSATLFGGIVFMVISFFGIKYGRKFFNHLLTGMRQKEMIKINEK